MLYILAGIALLFLSVFFILFYKNLNLKTEVKFLSKAFDESKLSISKLENEKIDHIKTIQDLSSKLAYKEQMFADFEKMQQDSKKAGKEALYEIGNELSKQLIEQHKRENQENRENSEKNIKDISQKFNSEFERIVNMVGSLNKEISQSKDSVDLIKNSLLSPSGAGSLAEITLENILKSSGLRENFDYIMQYSVIADTNSVLRPDCVIFLPDNKLMVIDAKASKFLLDDQDDKSNLSNSMKLHLRNLSSKNYAKNVQENLSNKKVAVNNIVTLMFLPSEHAIEKLAEADSKFMNKAWELDIFPVGPAGLMNMLSFAKFQISQQLMMHNHQQIIDEVKKLITSVGSMADHSFRLGNSISSVVNHYDKFAASFNRNFLSKVRNIGKMGIESGSEKNQKSLQRFQLVSSEPEIIEVNISDQEKLKKPENA